MPTLQRFRSLTSREKAIVAIAVLLDGHDAVDVLQSDRGRSQALTRAAADLAQLSPELRMPLIGTVLRTVVEELDSGGS